MVMRFIYEEVLQNHVHWISILCLSHDSPLLLPARYLNSVTKITAERDSINLTGFSGFSTEDTSIWTENNLKLRSLRSHSGNTDVCFDPAKTCLKHKQLFP